MKTVNFSKYTGCGNDFILIDNRNLTFSHLTKAQIIALCDRKYGIGGDGLIFLEKSKKAEFCMNYHNRDGTKASMCGNGMRCMVQFLQDLGVNQKKYTIEAGEKIYRATINHGSICIYVDPPKQIKKSVKFYIKNQQFSVDFLNIGVPHVVLFIDDIFSFPLHPFGKTVRNHSLFAPHGTNVNIAKIKNSNTIYTRTYERGVEEETLSCGTGAVAAALCGAFKFSLKSPITIIPTSKEPLIVHFSCNNGVFSSVKLEGPAKCIFNGNVCL